jgi:hypothetical protein
LASYARFEVFVAVKIHVAFFWVVTPRSVVGYLRFGRPHLLSPSSRWRSWKSLIQTLKVRKKIVSKDEKWLAHLDSPFLLTVLLRASTTLTLLSSDTPPVALKRDVFHPYVLLDRTRLYRFL